MPPTSFASVKGCIPHARGSTRRTCITFDRVSVHFADAENARMIKRWRDFLEIPPSLFGMAFDIGVNDLFKARQLFIIKALQLSRDAAGLRLDGDITIEEKISGIIKHFRDALHTLRAKTASAPLYLMDEAEAVSRKLRQLFPCPSVGLSLPRKIPLSWNKNDRTAML